MGALHPRASSGPGEPDNFCDWGSGWGRDDRRRRKSDRYAPAAHNPFAVRKPEFVEQVVIETEDRNRSSLLGKRG